MDAPVLLAKGARLLAARIKAIAAEEGIPVLENKPLARAIYASTPVGGPCPASSSGPSPKSWPWSTRLRAAWNAKP